MPSYVWYLLSFPRTRNPKMTRESHIRRVCDGVGSRKKRDKKPGADDDSSPCQCCYCCVGKPTFRIEGDDVSEGGFDEGADEGLWSIFFDVSGGMWWLLVDRRGKSVR
jgi:hypothetical protein